MSAYFRNCTLVVVLVAVVGYWVATRRNSTAADSAPSQAPDAAAQGSTRQPAIQGHIEGLEKVSGQLKLLLDYPAKLADARKRLLIVDLELVPVVQKAIRELQADQRRLKGEFEVTLRTLRPAEDGQHPKLAEQINRIQTAMRKLVGVPEPGPAADIPVLQLLLGLGVDPVLAASQSNWCECLDAVAHARRSDGGFVTLNGESFPALAPLPPPPIPADNRQLLHEVDDPNTPYNDVGFPRWDDPKVQLGYLLFFDTRLSGDNSVACSTCHLPDEGWGLTSDISRGYPGTSHWRNSHTAMNSAYMWKLFWAGDQNALEPQGRAANTGLSGNGKTDMMEERLRQCPDYVRMFKDVFGTELPLLEDAWRAIATFERVLIQPDTPFDRYLLGDKTALDEQQIRGLELFQGKAGCIKCHNGPMLTDQKYYNNGLPQNEGFLEDPLKQITYRFELYSKGASEEVYRNGKHDLGLYFTTKRKEDIGKFRTQTLRYLEFTPPYMHNGTFDTLEEVVEFYNKGGDANWTKKTFGIDNKSRRMKRLNLTDPEMEDIVAFLASLSGEEFKLPTPVLPDAMSFVYRGETYVGLPIPVVSTEAKVEDRKAVEKVTWSLVSGPKGATISAETGRVTWLNAQPPAEAIAQNKDIPITITIRATNVKDPSKTEDQTLLVTVYRKDPPSIESLLGTGAE